MRPVGSYGVLPPARATSQVHARVLFSFRTLSFPRIPASLLFPHPLLFPCPLLSSRPRVTASPRLLSRSRVGG